MGPHLFTSRVGAKLQGKLTNHCAGHLSFGFQRVRQHPRLGLSRMTWSLHREDESFDLLALSCLKTSCGVTEYREAGFTWPGQRSILYPVLKLYYFNVPEE